MSLDSPALWLGLYIVIAMAEHVLIALNVRYLREHGGAVPEEFKGRLEADTLARIERYTVDKARWGMAEALYLQALTVTFFFAGGLTWVQARMAGWPAPFVLQGVVFGLSLGLAWSLLQVPFDLVRVFRLEQAYGFNTQTPKQWVVDLIKGQAVAAVLGGGLLAGVLALVKAFPENWWVWVWGFYFVFTLFVMYLSPVVLEPLFNRFTPVPEDLGNEVRALAGRAGIRVEKVFQMDASRRSRHSNAYFTGLGRVKRIVLYDTLLAKMEVPEVLAVLAHEAGHWKQHHVLKRLALSSLVSLGVTYGSFCLLSYGTQAGVFGLPAGAFLTQAAFLLFLLSFLAYPFLPFLNAWSRRQERDADRFASRLLGTGEALRQALVKLSLDNLSNLRPHPWYAFMHYSHPPTLERLRALREVVPAKK